MTADAPLACVVVATHNRAHLLPRLLRALAGQTDAPSYAVVVVDDASGDDTPRRLADLQRELPIAITTRRLPHNRGPATARNVGWRSSDAPYVVFTDDDCEPQPGWLAAICRGLQNADLAQGRTCPAPDQLSAAGPFSRTLSVESEDGFYQTCNIGYRREWLQRLGGFDEDFRHPAGEDTELAWRAIEAGATTAFCPDGVVHHDVRPSSVVATLRDTPRWGSVVLAVRKHPPLRRRLHSPMFWRASHPPALAAVIGLAVAARRGKASVALGAALTLPYVRFRLQVSPLPHLRRRQRVLLLPAALLVDAAEVAVCAGASVRYRRLLL